MMKHLSILILLLLVLCCKKPEEMYEFAVICRIPFQYVDGVEMKLVVTDMKGEMIRVLDIKSGETNIDRRFEVPVENPLDVCNIHFAVRYLNSPYYDIFSHLEVQSGALVVFEPTGFIFSSISRDQKVIRVYNIESLDSLGFLGEHRDYFESHFDPFEKRGITSALFWQNQGAVVHIKANSESEYRYLYLSDSSLSLVDWSYDVAWSDFKPVPAPVPVTIADDFLPIQSLEVDAVAPDFKSYVSIGPGSNIDPLAPQFTQPEEVPKMLRVRVKGSGYAMEHIFSAGETVEFEAPDMEIVSATSSPGERLQIEVSGDVDLLEAVCKEPRYTWTLQGSPDAFKDLNLPQLSNYVRDLRNAPPAFKTFTVRAHRYGKHDYPQVREGFPHRSGEAFSVARSGYQMIEKSF
jgi:hypothetical protein